MKIMYKWAVVLPVSLLGSVALFVAYGHVRQQQENRNRLHVAATELRSSLAVGVNYSEFGDKLTHLYSAVTLATENGMSKRELAPYHDALELYKEGYDLWTNRVQYPKMYDTADQGGNLPWSLRGPIVKYKMTVKPQFIKSHDALLFVSKESNAALDREDAKDGHGFLHGWFDLPAAYDAVLQEIWTRAAAKLDTATH